MNLERRFIEISTFLKDHIDLIQSEPLNLYPNLPKRYLSWIENINQLSDTSKIDLENEMDHPDIDAHEYKEFLRKARELTQLKEKFYDELIIDKNLSRKISRKKIHEISWITQYLKENNSLSFVDVGSGAGHLSSILIDQGGKKSRCLDKESNYQNIGISKLKKYRPDILEKIDFETIDINEATKFSLQESETLLGLHACGDLSAFLIKQLPMNQGSKILNFGCCYHKLTQENLNLSQISKEEGIALNNFALTLAAKGYKPQDLEGLDQKLRVKTFRYGLHILNHELGYTEIKSVGNGLKADYEGDFISYIEKFAPSLTESHSNNELLQLFNSPTIKNSINNILSLGIVRSALARIIELYIVLDRAIYLNENGFKVELTEAFDKSLSPRNISLYSYRP